MKIRKSDLPKKNFEKNNVMCSIIKAINNKREGTYIDSFFVNEEDFINILDSLEENGIIKKEYFGNHEYNLKNYMIIKNINIDFKNRNSIKKWLKDNMIGLIGLVPPIIQLFNLVRK